ncbi:hypothetical protein [Streptacidiphilus fuscans]|uniref:Secreted protein n=1 Tax=Streptacidiphilus fuscans TaxID=2789292 RepID=A0A931FF09_9ACTN|nr:hypothetical protein [Streptacidiphilus fuscans]MBF9072362.1 hypothetical protein [Streptacidiphilus fuscans]
MANPRTIHRNRGLSIIMMKKVLTGTALAVGTVVSVAGPASAATCMGADTNETAAQAISSYHMSGDTSGGEGTYGNHFGDTVVGSQDGVINNNGAPLVMVDLRCAVPNATGVGATFGNKNSCNEGQVDQFHKGGILGG